MLLDAHLVMSDLFERDVLVKIVVGIGVVAIEIESAVIEYQVSLVRRQVILAACHNQFVE